MYTLIKIKTLKYHLALFFSGWIRLELAFHSGFFFVFWVGFKLTQCFERKFRLLFENRKSCMFEYKLVFSLIFPHKILNTIINKKYNYKIFFNNYFKICIRFILFQGTVGFGPTKKKKNISCHFSAN